MSRITLSLSDQQSLTLAEAQQIHWPHMDQLSFTYHDIHGQPYTFQNATVLYDALKAAYNDKMKKELLPSKFKTNYFDELEGRYTQYSYPRDVYRRLFDVLCHALHPSETSRTKEIFIPTLRALQIKEQTEQRLRIEGLEYLRSQFEQSFGRWIQMEWEKTSQADIVQSDEKAFLERLEASGEWYYAVSDFLNTFDIPDELSNVRVNTLNGLTAKNAHPATQFIQTKLFLFSVCNRIRRWTLEQGDPKNYIDQVLEDIRPEALVLQYRTYHAYHDASNVVEKNALALLDVQTFFDKAFPLDTADWGYCYQKSQSLPKLYELIQPDATLKQFISARCVDAKRFLDRQFALLKKGDLSVRAPREHVTGACLWLKYFEPESTSNALRQQYVCLLIEAGCWDDALKEYQALQAADLNTDAFKDAMTGSLGVFVKNYTDKDGRLESQKIDTISALINSESALIFAVMSPEKEMVIEAAKKRTPLLKHALATKQALLVLLEACNEFHPDTLVRALQNFSEVIFKEGKRPLLLLSYAEKEQLLLSLFQYKKNQSSPPHREQLMQRLAKLISASMPIADVDDDNKVSHCSFVAFSASYALADALEKEVLLLNCLARELRETVNPKVNSEDDEIIRKLESDYFVESGLVERTWRVLSQGLETHDVVFQKLQTAHDGWQVRYRCDLSQQASVLAAFDYFDRSFYRVASYDKIAALKSRFDQFVLDKLKADADFLVGKNGLAASMKAHGQCLVNIEGVDAKVAHAYQAYLYFRAVIEVEKAKVITQKGDGVVLESAYRRVASAVEEIKGWLVGKQNDIFFGLLGEAERILRRPCQGERKENVSDYRDLLFAKKRPPCRPSITSCEDVLAALAR